MMFACYMAAALCFAATSQWTYALLFFSLAAASLPFED